jgi:SAM-dependent methyltransferase
MKRATFEPNAYQVFGLEHAKQVTIGVFGATEEDTYAATEKRWIEETEYTLDVIEPRIPSFSSVPSVMDYGCGTGRVSKGLLDRMPCHVVGVDASPTMRGVAARYVGHQGRFRTCGNASLLRMPATFDYAISLWVLQHCGLPHEDIQLIHNALKPGAKLMVFNEKVRWVPTIERGFVNDGIDIKALLAEWFGEPVDSGSLDPTRSHPELLGRTWWAEYQKQ